jgi:hypothetical protein
MPGISIGGTGSLSLNGLRLDFNFCCSSSDGKSRISRPTRSMAHIIDCTWTNGLQLSVIPTSCVTKSQFPAKYISGGRVKLTLFVSVRRDRYISLQQPVA